MGRREQRTLGRRGALPRWRTRTPYLLAAVLAAAATFGLKDTHAGVRDTALNLGTGGAYVAFGDPAKLDLPAFTVETWFKRTGTGTPNTTGGSGVPALLPLLTHGAPEIGELERRCELDFGDQHEWDGDDECVGG